MNEPISPYPFCRETHSRGVPRAPGVSALGRLSRWLYATARPAWTVALLLLTFSGMWLFNASSGDWSVQRFEERFGEPILDVRPVYAPSMVAPLLERYGDNGRAAYLAFLRMDMLFLLIYGAAFSGLLSLLGRRRGRLSCLNLLPLGIALSDALENGFTAVQLAGYPQPFPWLAWGGALSSLSKNALTLGTLVVLSVWAAQAVRRRRAS